MDALKEIFGRFWKVILSLKPKRPHPPKLVCMHVTSIPTCINILSQFRSIKFFDDSKEHTGSANSVNGLWAFPLVVLTLSSTTSSLLSNSSPSLNSSLSLFWNVSSLVSLKLLSALAELHLGLPAPPLLLLIQTASISVKLSDPLPSAGVEGVLQYGRNFCNLSFPIFGRLWRKCLSPLELSLLQALSTLTSGWSLLYHIFLLECFRRPSYKWVCLSLSKL